MAKELAVIEESDIDSYAHEANKLLADGWSLSGSMIVCWDPQSDMMCYAQQFTREVENGKKD